MAKDLSAMLLPGVIQSGFIQSRILRRISQINLWQQLSYKQLVPVTNKISNISSSNNKNKTWLYFKNKLVSWGMEFISLDHTLISMILKKHQKIKFSRKKRGRAFNTLKLQLLAESNTWSTVGLSQKVSLSTNKSGLAAIYQTPKWV